ncbi:hypothetical protein SAMN05443287_101624 [Micromonospora phaseoli]|uniref:Uncharacterized protein n=1 Tax=Micromonospora phaseoli TaxID=1144548 RepID=A0A1H6SAJ8_9ACTN|nr:hypothetical protein [Micromonospora phaseoli]PZW03873.1 hypothetical protein CLV64_101624 [Micromonospora phaseoli]GIJ77713.1 hypothetical protein Xph01_21450 [Micromonospora phaseoli]SEI64931.1 hypothetical protein SAMN05443287_101624 [Micromonospora phaseoli]
MEKTVLYQFLIEVPRAAAIWSVLLVLALGVLTALVARPEPTEPTEPAGSAEEPAGRAEERAATEAADLRRYAGEVAVAATGAAQNADRRRTAWRTAQTELDRAWAAYDEAESTARRLAGTAGLPTPRTSRTPAEYAARERWLHRAAMAAHWRGDLTARQLSDVLARRAGWDPRRHPAEQEVILARVVRDSRLAAYRAAAERERDLWRAAEFATEASRALSAEAYAAVARLRPNRMPAPRPATVGRPTAVPRWRPARLG